MARLNLLAPEVQANPYPFLAELQRSSPVCQVDPNGAWLVTRYEDMVAALKDPHRFSSEGLALLAEPPWLGSNPSARSLVTAEPVRHGKLRTLVNRAFGVTGMARLEALVRQLAEELATEAVLRREVDFVEEFAFALPRAVIGHMLGLDRSVFPKLKRWGTAMAVVSAATTPEMQAEVRDAIAEMGHYLDEIIESRRREPHEDLVSDLLRAEVDGQQLSREDLVRFLFLLLPAGLETTTNLLGNMAMYLARHPEHVEKARTDKAHAVNFIEEVLRFECPIQALFRLTSTDVLVGGTTIPQGSMVILSSAAANRDERQFSEPERFLPGREKQTQHLAFGHGIHFCLGTQLARMEARLGLEALLSRIQGVVMKRGEVQWIPSLAVRGPAVLPVELLPLAHASRTSPGGTQNRTTR
ncbi:cytochrome P450 [Archangium violaceum]|uniref:cytochrome P450 n=1 Tax=Archangium violaceum TaxID=83451 RepID=UPI002B27D116|nr:cytochrome P450 [Archangium violaceum]